MKEKTKKEEKNNKVLLAFFISFLCLCLVVTIYLIGYKIGTIGVSSNIIKQLDVIKITSNSVEWNVSEELKIFKNPKLNNKNIIAPNSKGTYKFIVQNESPENIYYNLCFLDENRHKINMKFRLKLDNIYVIGDSENWIDISQMNMKNVLITSNSKTMYTLEWYWEEAENDSEIGKQDYSEYRLYINFTPNFNGEFI